MMPDRRQIIDKFSENSSDACNMKEFSTRQRKELRHANKIRALTCICSIMELSVLGHTSYTAIWPQLTVFFQCCWSADSVKYAIQKSTVTAIINWTGLICEWNSLKMWLQISKLFLAQALAKTAELFKECTVQYVRGIKLLHFFQSFQYLSAQRKLGYGTSHPEASYNSLVNV